MYAAAPLLAELGGVTGIASTAMALSITWPSGYCTLAVVAISVILALEAPAVLVLVLGCGDTALATGVELLLFSSTAAMETVGRTQLLE